MTYNSMSQNPLGYTGISFDQNPPIIIAQRAPTSQDIYPIGTRWADQSVSPFVIYTTIGNGTWDVGGNAYATTSDPGIVQLSADIATDYPSSTLVPTVTATKDYVDGVAIAGAPVSTETVAGIGQLATDAEAIAGTPSTGALALFVTPSNLAPVFAAPPALGGTTPAAGSFTTLAASGLASLSGSATITTGATALNLASDASTGAVNIGTGAGARAIVIGNVTGATGVTINTGTNHFTVNTTGTGDIILNSADTVLIDSAGVLELNSSAGVISIGNDAVAQAINIGTGAAARTITIGNSTGATSLVLDCGTGSLDIGTNAIAHTVTLGNSTGATSVVIDSGTGPINVGTNAIAHTVTVGNVTGTTAVNINVGTGNFALNGVGASTYTIGAATTTGTITIGGTAQTGTMTLGSSSGTNTVAIGAGEGETTVNIAGGATNIKHVNIATGAVASVIAVGSASAGAITVDTAAGISLDSATASNFTVTGAADLTLSSTAGSVIVSGGEAVADAVQITASDAAGGVDINAGTGGVTLDTTAGFSLDAATASNVTVTGAGQDLTLASAGGSVLVSSTENAALAIYLHANGGINETIRLHADQGTGVGSINLLSDVGGITLTATGLASADAINFEATAGGIDMDSALQTVITSSQNAATAIQLTASDAAGGVTVTAGTGGVNLAAADTNVSGNLNLTSEATQLTMNGGAATDFIGTGTLSSGTVTIANTNIAANDRIFIQRTSVNSSSAIGNLVYTISAATSFTVTSVSDASPGATETNDNSVFTYFIVRQT